MPFFVMRLFKCLTNKYSRQIRKDERLNESNQYLNHINENSQGYKQRGCP